MTTADLWLLVPATPLLLIPLLLRWPYALQPWLCCAALPALLLALWPAPALDLGYLWPGASWQAADALGRGWLAFTSVLWAAASLFAAGDLREDPHARRFWCFWLLALSGNLLLAVAGDALSFYIGFTVMSIAAYGLIVHYGGPKPRRAGRIYLQLAICGEMILFGAFAMRAYTAGGALSFAQWQQLPLDAPTLVLLLIGFGLKIGFWPLHVWLPLAHPAAPSPASAVLSGAMIEAGVLGLWRTLPPDAPLLQEAATALLVLGLITAFYGAAVGLIAEQVKSALAYSSVSQMGYLLAILALAWRHPEMQSGLALLLLLFAAHHGIAKGALFLGTGLHPLPARYAWLMLIPALAISGLPLTSGAAAKGELKHLLADTDFAHWSAWFKAGTGATTLLLARALWLLKGEIRKENRASPLMLLPWLLLCLLPLLLPWLWPAMREKLLASLTLKTSWELIWPLALALVLSLAAIRRQWSIPRFLREWRTPAIHFSIKLKRLLQNPPLPKEKPQPNTQWWRRQERRWNYFWNAQDTVATSAWLLAALLLLAIVW